MIWRLLLNCLTIKNKLIMDYSKVAPFVNYENNFIKIHLVPMFNDNYGYIFIDKTSKLTGCVDPGDGNAIIKALDLLKLDLNYVLCTHKHMDHVGGNLDIKNKFSRVNIIGTKYEEIPALTAPAGHNDAFTIGGLNVKVLHVPCHTRGHIAFYVTNNYNYGDVTNNEQQGSLQSDINKDNSPVLFSGDTLFVGGCGRFFEGTAEDMLKNMDQLSALPHNTKVFCAHEYTEANLKFLSSIDPVVSTAIYEEVKTKRLSGIPTIPSTIGEQLRYNLFMKCREERVQLLVNQAGCSPAEAMATLRAMKNNFK